MNDPLLLKNKRLVADWPKFLSYDKKDQKYYESTSKNEHSFFYKSERKLEIFIYAMAIGKSLGQKTRLENKSLSLPKDALKEDEVWSMIALYLAEPDVTLNDLKDPQMLVQTCEEYANTGIKHLMDMDNYYTTDNSYEEFENKFKEFLEE